MEAEKPTKSSRPSRNHRGPAVALKKMVEEIHHAPGLVGGIVEKGFSSSPGGGSGSPSSVPLPRSTVLPFPVARHRSHGPHWAPVGSAPVDAEEDEMVEDKDDTDYHPIASFANPIERKKKKSLNFSRWKDFVPKDDAPVPKSKKKEVKTGAVNAREVKRSGVVSNEEKKKSPSIYSHDIAMLDNEEVIRRDLTNRNFSEHITTMAEPKFVVEKSESEAGGSVSDVNGIYASAGQNPEINDTEMIEATGHQSSSLMDDIDAENLSRLSQMSAEEIAEARAEMMGKMDPALIEMLKKRGQNKLRSRKGIEQEQKLRGTKGIEHEQNKRRQELAGSKTDESGKSVTVTAPQGDWISKIESSNSSWKAWSERVEKVRSIRFSLNGDIVEISSTQHVSNGDKPKRDTYSVENVAERDLLRTEGDPAAVGYTINEAVALTRSMIPGQRAIALQLLASVLGKALYNLQQKDSSCHVRETKPIDNHVDWQAVWAFALGPEPQMALSLRIALDDNHDSVVLACVKAIQSLLSIEINENFFDTSEKLINSKKNTFTAPVFRSRPEIDSGFLHGGYWKYSTKSSNILPIDHQNNEDDGNEDKYTIQDDVVVAGQDIASGLVRMGILPRICYLLEMDSLPALEEALVSIVVALARHSPTCADAVRKCPNLVQTVVKIFTKQGLVERYSSQTKAVLLLKVRSWLVWNDLLRSELLC
ncbi:hypothetical protein Cni_G05725 [Canna indica]|uniref:Uncharacterized protein n=1 Tax=Canna indica TaxID=4628 RepID=A0AAQ3JVN1_9LILI|nr:hypothetical protein Cni_G05725 [Canna indica]